MALDINSLTNSSIQQSVPSYTANVKASDDGVSAVTAPAAAEKTQAVEEAAPKSDTYTPGSKSVIDADTVAQMKEELKMMTLRFMDTVQGTLTNQIKFGQGVWKDMDPEKMEEIRKSAQEAISDDGYWGVEQTSKRLIAFAQALTGGDASRAEEMRAAFIKGYKEVEKLWGGELPEVSQKTYDATMKLFDEWAGIDAEEAEAEA